MRKQYECSEANNCRSGRSDAVDLSVVAKEFAEQSDIRRQMFGNWN